MRPTTSPWPAASPSKIRTAPTCMGWLWSSRWRKDASSGVSLSVAMRGVSPADRRRSSSYRHTRSGGGYSGLMAPQKVVKSEQEWREQLTPEQYAVLREKATERPWSGEYCELHAPGLYRCAACG